MKSTSKGSLLLWEWKGSAGFTLISWVTFLCLVKNSPNRLSFRNSSKFIIRLGLMFPSRLRWFWGLIAKMLKMFILRFTWFRTKVKSWLSKDLLRIVRKEVTWRSREMEPRLSFLRIVSQLTRLKWIIFWSTWLMVNRDIPICPTWMT